MSNIYSLYTDCWPIHKMVAYTHEYENCKNDKTFRTFIEENVQ